MLMLPIVHWMVVGALFVGFVVAVTGEVRDPSILRSAEEYQAIRAKPGPYSFSAMYRRLPANGVRRVEANIRYFQTQGRRRLVDGLARGGKYLETYRAIFREMEMPEELAYLPLIESGFVPTAVSPAKAAGMWQFIEETGRRYNLNRTTWADNRLDPFHSARAAARLLKNLHGQLGDWESALAAYNSGAGTIRWARRVNKKASRPTDYWALDLPDETRNYVPHFMAAVLIAKNPAAYGFGEISFHPALAYEHIKVSPGTSLELLALENNLPLKALQELNPELIRGTIPPGEKPYRLRVPTGSRRSVRERLNVRNTKLRDWVIHPVSFEDTVEALALRFRAKPTRILEANGLENAEELITRNFVIIPL